VAREDLPEALLEMHYHSALIESFKDVFGATRARVYKPSQRRERFLGFDQAWVLDEELLQNAFFERLKADLATGAPSRRYVAYFLQFKRVWKLSRRSDLTPAGMPATHYRAELDCKIPANADCSQHERLRRLCQLTGCETVYACPMVFTQEQLWKAPDLELLRLVSLTNSPKYDGDGERHFIFFKKPTDAPVWASTPVPAHAMSGREFAKHLRLMELTELVATLQRITQVDEYRWMHRALTIVMLES